jgi:hypothetical protein
VRQTLLKLISSSETSQRVCYVSGDEEETVTISIFPTQMMEAKLAVG